MLFYTHFLSQRFREHHGKGDRGCKRKRQGWIETVSSGNEDCAIDSQKLWLPVQD